MATRRKAGAVKLDEEDAIPPVPLFRVSPGLESLDSGIDRRSFFYREKALEKRGDTVKLLRRRQAILTLPTILTLLRITLVPVFALCWYQTHASAALVTASIFILASISDWLDGYLARRLGLATAFGAFLDPVADKIMVCTALVLLATNPPPPISQPAMVVPTALIISREITMSALREWAAASSAEAHKGLKVSSLGKWKTALQMTAMSLLLLLRDDHVMGSSEETVRLAHNATVGCWGILLGATALALWSLAKYMENVWDHFAYVHSAHS